MLKRISLIQMDIALGKPEKNYSHALDMMTRALADQPDILVLPETLNTGFFPRKDLSSFADIDGATGKAIFSSFAKEYGVNIVAGSLTTLKEGKIYNTSYAFNRKGELVSEYDKIHSFTPMEEHKYYTGGEHLSLFTLDDVPCATAICYDLRFGELLRSMALKGAEIIFIPAHWPSLRTHHWVTLNTARAIENQLFVCAVNACGTAGDTKFAGNSLLIDPWGEAVCHLGPCEEVRTVSINMSVLKNIRESINVFRDRRPDLYEL